MEYILIFISAIFVNNIVLSQFLGICPFLGVSKKVETAMGMSAAVAFVLTIATIEVCVGRFRIGVLTDNHFYSGYCRTGADGRNYSEESFSFFVSGTGCVPAVDYNELLYSRCGNPGNPERL